MTQERVDSLLLQFTPGSSHSGTSELVDLAQVVQQYLRPIFPGVALKRVAQQQGGVCYLYLDFVDAVFISADQVTQAELELRASPTPELAQCHLSRLQLVMHRDGPSCGLYASVHYVVEMDPESGWQDELFRWYDEEHLPGLASVTGTVRADRYLNLDHGPLSLACYDLIDEAVMGCPEWLAVRATSWSDRVRPHFTNTKRTMFDKLM